MKSLLLKTTFKDALAIVERVTAKSPTLPILGNILLEAKKNYLELSATDLEAGIRYQVLSKNDEEGKVVVPARFLSQLIPLFADSQLVLEEKEGALIVKGKGHTTKVKILSPEDFPILPSSKGDETVVELDAALFAQGISQVVGMAGQTQVRPEISGVLFSFKNKELKLVATDSFRLAEKTLPLLKKHDQEFSFILPQKTAREISGILTDKQGNVSLLCSPSQIIFEYFAKDDPAQTRIEIVSRLIEGEYPKYEDVIPQSYSTTMTVSRSEFLNNVKAASIFTGKTNDVLVALDPEKRAVEFSARNADVGESASEMRAEGTGVRAEIAFNWRFLSDGISQMKSDLIEIGVSGEDGPALIKPKKAEGYLYVVMPIKA